MHVSIFSMKKVQYFYYFNFAGFVHSESEVRYFGDDVPGVSQVNKKTVPCKKRSIFSMMGNTRLTVGHDP